MCRKIVASSADLPHPVNQLVGRPLQNQQPYVHHGPQVPLQRPPVDLGAQALEILDSQAAVLRNVSECLGLAIRKARFLDERIPVHGPLPALSDFGKLGGQSLDELFHPAGHVRAALTDAPAPPALVGSFCGSNNPMADATPIPAALDKLEVDEGLEVKKTEYSGKTDFRSYAHNSLKKCTKKHFRVRSLRGW